MQEKCKSSHGCNKRHCWVSWHLQMMDTQQYSHLGNKEWPFTTPMMSASQQRHHQCQGWRDKRGLWIVLIANSPKVSPSFDIAERAMRVYELPSTKKCVWFVHATLGFPTKATLLTSRKTWEPCQISRPNAQKYTHAFPWVGGAAERAYEADKAEYYGCRWAWNAWVYSKSRGKAQRLNLMSIQCYQEDKVLRLNQKTPHYVCLRKQIHHSGSWVRWKLHQHWANSVKKGKGTHWGIRVKVVLHFSTTCKRKSAQTQNN